MVASQMTRERFLLQDTVDARSMLIPNAISLYSSIRASAT